MHPNEGPALAFMAREQERRRRVRACRGIHGAGPEAGNPPAGKFDPDCPACADFARKWLIDLTPGAGYVVAASDNTGEGL